MSSNLHTAPASINPHLSRPPKRVKDQTYYIEGIGRGDRVVLGQAITLIESRRAADQELAAALVDACLPRSGKSLRLGITGVPGVGKSTFIEALGMYLVEKGHRLAILAVDPSSQLSRGSILGDKTRMARLSVCEQAFIRPSPAGDSLGGVAQRTRESMLLCEAAGYDIILVETVGVGQSETAVHAMTDFFLLLLLPGAGDELQGIKRGIVEMADLIAVNKADGEALMLARQAKAAYQQALHLFPPKESHWSPEVLTCSAAQGLGIGEIWSTVEKYCTLTQKNAYFEEQRRLQAIHWLHDTLRERLLHEFYKHPDVRALLPEVEESVRVGLRSTPGAAQELLRVFRKTKGL